MSAPGPATGTAATTTGVDDLRASARGWHGVQLAVLGFIGLCGALQDAVPSSDPAWLQQVAFALVLVALALACAATVLVASAAWPVYGAAHRPVTAEVEAEHTGRRLRTGVVLTFVCVAVLAVATSSAWWPSYGDGADGDTVELSTAGGTVCGTLLGSEAGTVTVRAAGREFVVPVADIVSLRPANSCPAT